VLFERSVAERVPDSPTPTDKEGVRPSYTIFKKNTNARIT